RRGFPPAPHQMIYRTVAALIVVFWLVMTTLLIRNEVNPEDSRVREVPLTHVFKLLYLHEQASDLRIYAGGTSIGHLRFHPRIDKETHDRLVEFTGTIQLQVPDRRRISWDGTLRMNQAYELMQSEWGVTLHDPGFLRLEVASKANQPNEHITIRNKDRAIQEMDVPLHDMGLRELANQFRQALQLAAFLHQARSQAQTQAKPILRARQSSIRYRGAPTETYLVRIERNGHTASHCQLSQMGQIQIGS